MPLPRARAARREWGPDADSDSLAKRVAQRINGTCVCVYGAVPDRRGRDRWKCQLNENSKIPAFAAELPEADHNEIVGWQDASDAGQLPAVFLEDVDQHPRVRQRIELTAELIEPQAAGRAPGEPRLEPRWSGCCRSCCSGTWCRSTWPYCAARTPRRWS